MDEIKGKRVAILVEEEYQDQEVWYPYYRLKEAGATVKVLGTGKAEYKSKFGYPIKPDAHVGDVGVDDFDCVIVPGGWAPDRLRRHAKVNQFVAEADAKKKLIAAICHASSVLVSAHILRGRTITSFPAVKDDAVYAGAKWVDREVCVDGNLITSRQPDDLPAFCAEIIEALKQVRE
jgi:protease I